MKATDVKEYASIVQHAYGEGAQEFARRMVDRFAGSDTEVELFWRTVDENLKRAAAQQKSHQLTPKIGRWQLLRQIRSSAASVVREALTPDPASLKRPIARTSIVSSP